MTSSLQAASRDKTKNFKSSRRKRVIGTDNFQEHPFYKTWRWSTWNITVLGIFQLALQTLSYLLPLVLGHMGLPCMDPTNVLPGPAPLVGCSQWKPPVGYGRKGEMGAVSVYSPVSPPGVPTGCLHPSLKASAAPAGDPSPCSSLNCFPGPVRLVGGKLPHGPGLGWGTISWGFCILHSVCK